LTELPGRSCAASERFASIVRLHPRYAAPVVTGGILIGVVMLLLLPVAVMLGGAIWSALLGWLLVDDADRRAAPEQS
jgi:membrane associated rhomboid family serine protease